MSNAAAFSGFAAKKLSKLSKAQISSCVMATYLWSSSIFISFVPENSEKYHDTSGTDSVFKLEIQGSHSSLSPHADLFRPPTND
jgi:hypothetical protein